ncbi:substrate-binding domain-containing protein [Chitinimonas koreensis]|uniref:substrate-binding domain-containing protein n=1 Tax=Chitinimonas koreensis TaxID=356302 RepID=UPI0004038AC5|nr:substrate-binding domain-containing protein [Chitinimonas koreensis]QNM98478.1 substrate-binding domain-containing protein [Chitinimonas koreensis]
MNRRQFGQAALCLALPSLPLAAPARPLVGMVLKSMRNEFFVQMADGARAHQRRRQADYELAVAGVQEETDVKGQETIVQQLLARRAGALVVVPADSVAMLPILIRAVAAGTLVINMDNKLDDRALAAAQLNIPFVGPSNFAGARSVGAQVAQGLPPGSRIGLVEGPPGSINAKARSDGFREAIRAAGMEIAGIRSGFWEVAGGEKAARELLEAEPKLRALLCGNDNMAIGAVKAVEAMGLHGKVAIAGYDNIPAIRPYIADGRVVATADQYPAKQAEYALELAIKSLASGARQEDLPGIVPTPVQLVTRK